MYIPIQILLMAYLLPGCALAAFALFYSIKGPKSLGSLRPSVYGPIAVLLLMYWPLALFGVTRTAMRKGLLPNPITKLAPTRDGDGYWLVDHWGRFYAFGTAQAKCYSAGRMLAYDPKTITADCVDIDPTTGHMFSGTDFLFLGEALHDPESPPTADLAWTPTGKGYWIVDERGKVDAFGDAEHFGDLSHCWEDYGISWKPGKRAGLRRRNLQPSQLESTAEVTTQAPQGSDLPT